MLADDPLGARREVWCDPLHAGYNQAFEAIRKDPNNELVVAVIGDQLVGMLQLTFIPQLTYQGRWRALIEGVRIHSNARSQGLGAAMVRYAIQRARDRSCVMVPRRSVEAWTGTFPINNELYRPQTRRPARVAG